MHTQAHGLTYNTRIALAAHAKHCTRTRTVCTPKHTDLRTIASLRLPMSNTVQVQLQCARLRTCTHVQRTHRSGYPCRRLCKYKYSVPPTSTHPCTICASLRPALLLTLLIDIAPPAFLKGDSWSLEVIFSSLNRRDILENPENPKFQKHKQQSPHRNPPGSKFFRSIH